MIQVRLTGVSSSLFNLALTGVKYLGARIHLEMFLLTSSACAGKTQTSGDYHSSNSLSHLCICGMSPQGLTGQVAPEQPALSRMCWGWLKANVPTELTETTSSFMNQRCESLSIPSATFCWVRQLQSLFSSRRTDLDGGVMEKSQYYTLRRACGLW